MTTYHRNKAGKILVCTAKLKCKFEVLEDTHPDLIAFLEAKKARSGVNVSEFETKYVNSFIDYVKTGNVDTAVLDIPSENRPVLYRNYTTEQEVKDNFEQLKTAIKTHLGVETIDLTTNRNNRSGSDLVENNTGRHIELKLGSGTAGNVGLETATQVIPEDLIAKLPNRLHRELWRKMYASDPEKAKQQISANHLTLLKEFASEMNKNLRLSDTANSALNQFYQGLNLGQDESTKVSTFYFRQGNKWEESSRPYVENEDWKLDKAVVDDKTGRLTIYCHNKTLNSRWKATFNYKNNFDLKREDGTVEKVPAKVGLGTPSFNFWFFPINKPTEISN